MLNSDEAMLALGKDLSRTKFLLDCAKHQTEIQGQHIAKLEASLYLSRYMVKSSPEAAISVPKMELANVPKLAMVDAACQTIASGDFGFTLPTPPEQVVYRPHVYRPGLVEFVESIPEKLQDQLTKSNVKRALGDVYEYAPIGYVFKVAKKAEASTPPMRQAVHYPPARYGFPRNSAWYRRV